MIPELVSGIQYRKGPYFVEDGDFTTAGSANVNYANFLDQTIARVDGGSFDYVRGLLAGSPKVGEGNLLYGLEAVYDNGPWVTGDAYRKYNGVLRYSLGDASNGLAVTAMGYSASWNATDQIPDRAAQSGAIPRFGAVDPTDGGESSATACRPSTRRRPPTSLTRAVAYAVDSRLDLFSNFTYFLDHPDTGDQFEQLDDRDVYGFKATHRWFARMFGVDAENELGVQGRFDDIHSIGLFRTEARERLDTTRLDRVKQYSGAVYAQNDTPWTPKFRTILGLRGDLYPFDVRGNQRSRERRRRSTKGILSPKLSMIFGPFGQTELYANAGYGFHSNDARGATITRDPSTGEPASPSRRSRARNRRRSACAACRSRGGRRRWRSGASTSTRSSSSSATRGRRRRRGRAGATASSGRTTTACCPGSPSTRTSPFSKARFRDDDPAGNLVPGAIQNVFSGGVSVDSLGGWSGSLRVRYFGPRPLDRGRQREVERVDDGQRARSATS